ncbi:hypothetical protein J2S76_002765 [Ancylobacter vacuolatus]|uniref:Uncharacterized protein n=1 Tax=Ancylobacter vacuolatus TaxID=223389 RepID=A0ABU0DIT1_9HYPH|nr:hypothetical protein [Ancylobacter vacuolatus]
MKRLSGHSRHAMATALPHRESATAGKAMAATQLT